MGTVNQLLDALLRQGYVVQTGFDQANSTLPYYAEAPSFGRVHRCCANSLDKAVLKLYSDLVGMPNVTNDSTTAADLGRMGGSVRSEAKAVKARENGKLGGKPAKSYATVIFSDRSDKVGNPGETVTGLGNVERYAKQCLKTGQRLEAYDAGQLAATWESLGARTFRVKLD